jgi:TonB-dependent receptor
MAIGRLSAKALRTGGSCLALATALGLMPAELAMATGSAAFAQQDSGSIRGTVVDASTQLALEGARVTIVETGQRVVTDRTGSFEISNVPAGSYSLRIEYLGLPTATVTAAVGEAGGGEVAVQLGAAAADGSGEIIVTGQVNETTRRLNQERAAGALTEIAASDAAAEFPDRNIGEVLQRLTGVFIDRNGTGEGNLLVLRAVNPANNLVLVEGMRMPSGRPDGRVPNLATINSDVVESIEVRKVFTPEIPGDFIGGYVNVRQPSAFDRRGLFFSTSLETGRRSISNNGQDFEANLRLSNTFLNDTLGVALALGAEKRDGTFHQFGAQRNPNIAGPVAATLPTVFTYREVNSRLPRYSGNLTIDFRPTDSARYFARGFLNYGEDSRPSDEQLNILFTPATGSTPGVGTFATIQPELATVRLDITERLMNFVAGGENQFDDWSLSYSAGYNELDGALENSARFAARSPVRAAIGSYDFTDPVRPELTLPNPAILGDPTTFGAVITPTTNLAETDEEQYIVQGSIARNVPLEKGRIELRAGARFDQRDRRQDAGGGQGYPAFPFNAALTTPGEDRFFRDDYSIPIVLNADALFDVFDLPDATRPPGDPNYRASIAGDFTGREKIYAGYAMGTFEFHPIQVIAGLRYEKTRTSGTNVVINNVLYNPVDLDPLDEDPSDGVAPNRIRGSYSRWLPALVLRAEPTPNLLIRASATRTYGRPTLPDLLSGESISPLGAPGGNNRAINRGNPALVPQDAWNFDASVDLYGSRANVVRLGLFYKTISNVFFTAQLTEPNPLGGTDTITQRQNGGDAKIFGIEAGVIQGLSFLPSPLDRLSIEANMGLAWSEQEVLGPSGAVIRKTDLEGSYGFIGNASLVYRADWGRARIAYRRNGKRLNAIDTNPSGGFNDAFRDGSTGLDADVSFNLFDRFSVSLETRNILNKVEVVEYLGSDRDALTRAQYSGWSIGGGITYRLGGRRQRGN